ncbi:type II toxin-antitoxin system HicB family antitoxin [Salinarimonas chemoclinalis]|uniref:type II toxin-antitoxin system HicB family antitoxin n=1 Tax=Salinarimonas chemoclinalis TaxID=3241599 RepID=UPI003558AB84
MQLSYPVAIEPVDGDHVVVVRGLPEIVTAGDTVEEALALAADALEVVLGARMDRGRDVPEPTAPEPGEQLVPLLPLLGAKLAVYLALRTSGISADEFAARLGVAPRDVRDLLSTKADTPLASLARAAEALDTRLVIGLEPARDGASRCGEPPSAISRAGDRLAFFAR